MSAEHFVPAHCQGEKCRMCGRDATHKVEEENRGESLGDYRHSFTAYVCCDCFRKIFGPAVPCGKASD